MQKIQHTTHEYEARHSLLMAGDMHGSLAPGYHLCRDVQRCKLLQGTDTCFWQGGCVCLFLSSSTSIDHHNAYVT